MATMTVPLVYVLVVGGSLALGVLVAWWLYPIFHGRPPAPPAPPAPRRVRLSGIQQEGPDGVEPAETPLPTLELARRQLRADFPTLPEDRLEAAAQEILQQAKRLGLTR